MGKIRTRQRFVSSLFLVPQFISVQNYCNTSPTSKEASETLDPVMTGIVRTGHPDAMLTVHVLVM